MPAATMADGWQNIAEAAHVLLHAGDEGTKRTGSDEWEAGLEQ